MTYKLFDIADVIRSKNSGPYELTFDIIFKDHDMFERVSGAGVINADSFAALYKIDRADILNIVGFAPAKAIKITIRRPLCSGGIGECDVYGACQHTPLLGFCFEL